MSDTEGKQSFNVFHSLCSSTQRGSIWLWALRGLWLWFIWGAHVGVSRCTHQTVHQVVQTAERKRQSAEECKTWVHIRKKGIHPTQPSETLTLPLLLSKALCSQRDSQRAPCSDLDGSQWGSRPAREELRILSDAAWSQPRPQTGGNHPYRSQGFFISCLFTRNLLTGQTNVKEQDLQPASVLSLLIIMSIQNSFARTSPGNIMCCLSVCLFVCVCMYVYLNSEQENLWFEESKLAVDIYFHFYFQIIICSFALNKLNRSLCDHSQHSASLTASDVGWAELLLINADSV